MQRRGLETLRSGALAKAVGLSPGTLRHYERMGVLPRPSRTAGGYRLYPASSVERIRVVQNALRIGFTLAELAEVLKARDAGGAPCRRVFQLEQDKLKKVSTDINALKQTERYLKKVLKRVAQRIQLSFTRPFILEGQHSSADAILQNADIAMYRAKDQGKACSELFDRTMHEQVMRRLFLESQLRSALQNDELALHYQPIVTVDTGVVQGFEALLRWQPKLLDPIPPSTFIPIAEQCGLIVDISMWALKAACVEAARWRSAYSDDSTLYVSINVSSRHFSHPDFISHVRDALEESRVDPESVTIELTESLAMSDVATTEQTMAQLRKLGVKAEYRRLRYWLFFPKLSPPLSSRYPEKSISRSWRQWMRRVMPSS